MEVELQDCTTLSTTEAEYIATSEATKEAIKLHQLSVDFSDKGQIDRPVPNLYLRLTKRNTPNQESSKPC